MFGCPALTSPMPTRSEASVAAAAFRHLASSAKSRKAVFTATPPATEPANTSVVTISVHIRLALRRPSAPEYCSAIRPTDHAALGADHARPELAHQEIARVLVDVEAHLVAAS